VRTLLGLVGILAAVATANVGARQPSLTVSDAWARATVEGQTGSGIFLRLRSSEDAQLVGASSSAAERVEIHEMRVVNGMMTMRRIERLPLPAEQTVALEHDYHVMLIGLKRPLQPGRSVVVTLHWLDATGMRRATDVVAPIRALNADAGSAKGKRE